MSKARLIGMNNAYIPNSKADARYNKAIHRRGRDFAERPIHENNTRRGRRELRDLEKAKGATK